MNRNIHTNRLITAPRRGFTLVEMLVALALVLLMMAMFAQIFALATSSLSTQKGIAENDQKARRLETTLIADLERRTYRARLQADGSRANGIVPLMALSGLTSGTDLATPNPPDPEAEIGYFYISENDPNNDTDDVLQFTIQSNLGDDPDGLPFFGKSTLVGLATELNQPEADDGGINWIDTTVPPDMIGDTFEIFDNNRGSSHFAEVSYFLRNGNLYRRISLIREPLDDGTPLPGALQGNYAAGSGVFWRDFDYSAFYKPPGGTTPPPDSIYFFIADLTDPNSALYNSAAAGTRAETISLGLPKYRFGFWGDFNTASPGAPREFANVGETLFFGRFTHEETSNDNFGYPGINVSDGTGTNFYMNSTVIDGSVDLTDTNNDVIVDGLENGPRRAEDIMLSNVHSFNIQVYDSALGEFENLGHSREDGAGNPSGDYHQNKNANPGPAPGYGNRFDTWHVDQDAIGNQQTPYRPVDDVNFGPDGLPGVAADPLVPGSGDDDNNGTADDNSEIGWPGSDDVIPLRAIKITIRYHDITSDQMRDLTIIHSFSDRDSD